MYVDATQGGCFVCGERAPRTEEQGGLRFRKGRGQSDKSRMRERESLLFFITPRALLPWNSFNRMLTFGALNSPCHFQYPPISPTGVMSLQNSMHSLTHTHTHTHTSTHAYIHTHRHAKHKYCADHQQRVDGRWRSRRTCAS
jgi:hypothetical protein